MNVMFVLEKDFKVSNQIAHIQMENKIWKRRIWCDSCSIKQKIYQLVCFDGTYGKDEKLSKPVPIFI